MKKLIVLSFLVLSFTSFGLEKIKLATMNWEPFYSEELPENGFYTALCREALKRSGYELEVVFLPWKRALEDSKKGVYDGLLGAYYNDERAEFFIYSDVVAKNEEVFIQKKGKGIQYNSIEDIKNYKVGATRGGAQGKELMELGVQLDEATNPYQNILKVNAGRLDLALIGKKYFNHYVRYSEKKLEGKMEILPKPFKSYDLFTPISKARSDAKLIVEKFNKSLAEMKADGTYAKIMEEFGQ